jgi:hypothetical protein
MPYTTSQAPDRADIVNIGAFGDAVFSVVASFLAGDAGPIHARGRVGRVVSDYATGCLRAPGAFSYACVGSGTINAVCCGPSTRHADSAIFTDRD